ncbi:hypothetical protein [Burkholderia multivorans]|uniref:hypothetical protein n=1 Tax=Burkholderia multivorans TaxID=87883 RepID=UPI00158EBBBD|nr:hypothetical protein [Burkholderia multivorans]
MSKKNWSVETLTDKPTKCYQSKEPTDKVRKLYLGNGEWTTDHTGNYKLPSQLKGVNCLRVQLFHNENAGSGTPEWTLKIHTSSDKNDYVNFTKFDQEVFFNMQHGRNLNDWLRRMEKNNSWGHDNMSKRNFIDTREEVEMLFQMQKNDRKKGEKKNKEHVFDAVLAGFCTVKKRGFATHVHNHHQVFLLPFTEIDAEGNKVYKAIAQFYINSFVFQVELEDVRSEDRKDGASEMIGYYEVAQPVTDEELKARIQELRAKSDQKAEGAAAVEPQEVEAEAEEHATISNHDRVRAIMEAARANANAAPRVGLYK